jgi:cobalamin biosynthetic protein CobC
MSEIINNTTKPLHGGDVTVAARNFGRPEDQWIDLSTGINRTSYPNTQLSTQVFQALPNISDMENLLTEAKLFYEVNINSEIMAGPGTQSILKNLPLLFPKREICILTPTYSEHQYTWEQAGNKVLPVNTLNAVPHDIVAVVVNPNNPNGRKYQVEDLINLSENLELLVIDEAFCDYLPDLSVIPHLAKHKILVLRSLGKFFGLAGLRLGFAVGMPEITQQLLLRLGPWAVSGPAIEIGTRALSDTSWVSEMRKILKSQSLRLNNILEKQNISILGSTTLFTLIKTDYASEIFSALAAEGILLRQFENYKTWLRIGLPGAENEWQKLEYTLNSTLNTINNMRK